MARKKEYKPDYFASRGEEHDNFGMIYMSLMTDERFINLSRGAKLIYCCCRVQQRSKESKQMLFKHGEEFGRTYSDRAFVFPCSHQERFGFNDRSNFARGMRELIDAGFIEKVEDNKVRRKVNVYQFSCGWKNKTRDDI